MSPEFQRPRWEIDRRLEALIGENIRVRACAFCPAHWNGEPGRLMEAASLVLPDNTTVGSEELYFEGQLREFRRDVAIVYVFLERPQVNGGTASGRTVYRGRTAVILPGPATVQLHSRRFIERIPTEEKGYWNHLAAFDPQMSLPLDE